MSGSRLFGLVVEHWIIDSAVGVRFPPKSWDFFQLNLLCFVLCYDFHVVRTESGKLIKMHLTVLKIFTGPNELSIFMVCLGQSSA